MNNNPQYNQNMSSQNIYQQYNQNIYQKHIIKYPLKYPFILSIIGMSVVIIGLILYVLMFGITGYDIIKNLFGNIGLLGNIICIISLVLGIKHYKTKSIIYPKLTIIFSIIGLASTMIVAIIIFIEILKLFLVMTDFMIHFP